MANCFVIDILEDGTVLLAQLTQKGNEGRGEDDDGNWADWTVVDLDEVPELIKEKMEVNNEAE